MLTSMASLKPTWQEIAAYNMSHHVALNVSGDGVTKTIANR